MPEPRKDCHRCGKRKYAYEIWDRCGLFEDELIHFEDNCRKNYIDPKIRILFAETNGKV